MEFSPVGPSTDDDQDQQESMFDDAADFPGHDLTELPEAAEVPEAFEPGERDDYAEPPLAAQGETQFEADSTAHAESLQETYPNANLQPVSEPVDLHADGGPLTIGDFAALEERVLRAVNLVRRERQTRLAAEQRAEVLEGRVLALESQLPLLQADTAVVEQLQQEVETLRTEREQVRQRVERLLGQLDALEL